MQKKIKKSYVRHQRVNAFLLFYLCEAVRIFSCAFCFGSGVAQGEDNRMLIQAAHCSDDIMSKEPASP